MASQDITKPDHWSSEAYAASAGFVPKLTSTILSYLSPSPTDRILDLGCGDGQLTAHIASLVPEGHVVGLDASTSMIAAAQTTYPSATHPNLTFHLQDCSRLDASQQDLLAHAPYDRIFSNAALHWILRPPAARSSLFAACHALLRPGGLLVAELGGAGNVGEVQAALVAGLVAHGVPVDVAREASPWFFPGEVWMRSVLGAAGFEVETVETEYRPTKLMESEKGGGLEGWVRLMGAQFLQRVEEGKREALVRWVCDVLEAVVRREGEDGQWLGYVRLRAVARKPVSTG